MTDYTYTVDLEVRFRDLDPMGHVNNALYATYLEQARAHYFDEIVGTSLPEAPTVLAHLEIDYRHEINLEDTATVSMRVPRLGESSIPMEYEIRAGDDVAATAETVQVVFDWDTRDSRSIPSEWRRNIESFEGL